MAELDSQIQALRQALEMSPENVPLRRLLAETLLKADDFASAENEYRLALRHAPDDVPSKLGMARACLKQGKNGVGLVLVEDVLGRPDAPAEAHVLYAWLLARTGRIEEAVERYRQGMALDANAADPELAERLGVGAQPQAASVVEGRVRASVDDIFEEEEEGPERPRISFADVGGMDALKNEIRMKIILPMTNQDLFAAYGKKAGGGILMYGPPGCGKTYLARATAGEIKAGFISVGLHDVLDMWLGQSEHRLHEFFQQARNNAPCVLFFDEVDALGASRSDMRHSAARHLINQFLSELDGVDASNEGILILAATNAPWHLDSAFRRPGRFDRILFVPPPDAEARAAILDVQLRGKPAEAIDLAWLAKKTDGFSGADLKAVVDLAVEVKLTEAMKTGAILPLTSKDLAEGARRQRPTTKEWFATARNYALFSNEAGLYDDILAYLGLRKP